MRDLISIPRVQDLHPSVIDRCKKNIEDAEAKLGPRTAIRVVEWYRSIAYQNGLYAIGRTVMGKNPSPALPMGQIVTRAKGGYSFHNYGLAIDFALLYDLDGNGTFETLSWDLLKDYNQDGEADWKTVVEVFQADGWESGEDWKTIKDYPHLEYRNGFSEDCRELLAKYNAGDFISGTQFVNI